MPELFDQMILMHGLYIRFAEFLCSRNHGSQQHQRKMPLFLHQTQSERAQELLPAPSSSN
eukprot:Gb_25536 [translate_table: standard]